MAYKLSKKAAVAKKKRDLAAAKTPDRRKKKAENQKLRRKAKNNKKNLRGKDYDHTKGRFTSVKNNREGTEKVLNLKNLRKNKKKVKWP